MKYGACRLVDISQMGSGLQFWDTPIPPDLEKCGIQSQMTGAPLRFHTINPASATGITFFFHGGELIRIHTHTKNEPSAKPTIDQYPDWVRRYTNWVYVPLPSTDTLVSFGQQAVEATAEDGGYYPRTGPYFLVIPASVPGGKKNT